MNTWVEAPPRQKRLGCFARGCLILLLFVVVLVIACVAGVFWGFQRYSAIAHGIYWLGKTHSIAEAPAPVPEFTGSDSQIQSLNERWQDFEQKARADQPAEIQLTADDINAVIAANHDVRGKVFVSIDGNQLHVQVNVPLGDFLGRPGYYFNGDITIEFKGAESLDNPQLNRIVVNGERVPSDLLNWKYRSRQLREYLADYRNDYDIGTIEVRDGKLILRSRTE
jgi:hypothetical protein